MDGFSSIAKVWQAPALYLALALIIAFCLVTDFFAYFKVYRVVIRHQAQSHSQMQVMSANADHTGMPFKHLRRSAMTIFYVYCLFLFCSLPCVATLVGSLFAGNVFGKYYAVPSTLVFLNFSYIH